MKMKKLLALFLGASMLLSSATAINASAVTTDNPAAAVSHDARGESGTTDSGLLWDLTDGVLTISTNGTDTPMESYQYPNNSADWRAHSADIESVEIKDGVTSIGDEAFYNCTSLTSVTIPDSVTSIGIAAFDRTPWLANQTETFVIVGNGILLMCNSSSSSVTIPDSVTSIGNYAFKGCTNLTSVTIPNSVTSIGEQAFSSCAKLTLVTIPNSITSIGYYTFDGTPWLANQTEEFVIVGNGVLIKYNGTSSSATIPDRVTSIGGGAFEHCESLTSVTIGNSVTSIGDSAFFCCTSLTSVTIPKSVKSIGDKAFCSCDRLQNVIFEEGSVLESIGAEDSRNIDSSCFSWCFSLETIVFPASLKYIGGWTFTESCSLTSIYFEGNMPDNIENALAAEEGWNMPLAQIYVLNGGTVDISEENPVPQKDGYVFNCYSESNESVIAPDYTKYDRDYLECYWDANDFLWKSNVVDLEFTWDDGGYYYYLDGGNEVRLNYTYVLYAHYNEVTDKEVSADDRVVDSTQTSTLVGLETLGLQIRNVEKQGYEEQPRGYISTSKDGDATRFVGALTDETITSLVSGGCEILEYGFVVAKTANVEESSLTVDNENATVVNCSSSYAFSDGTVVTNPGEDINGSAIEKDRSNTDTYRIFSLVLEYDSPDPELLAAAKAEQIVGRAYLKYIDGNGRTSVIYGRYGGTVVKGGCSASYNQVAQAAWNEILRH